MLPGVPGTIALPPPLNIGDRGINQEKPRSSSKEINKKTTHLFLTKQHQQSHHPNPKNTHSLPRPHNTVPGRHQTPRWLLPPTFALAHWARFHLQLAGRIHCSKGYGSCRRPGCSRKGGSRALFGRIGGFPVAGRRMRGGLR